MLIFHKRLLPVLTACLGVGPLLGCGARSTLDDTSLTATSLTPMDACPAAISGPKPMTGNCSTRDGRSRVPAPTAPHLTWTTKLPTDSTGQLGPSNVATDASGHAYVVTTGEIDESIAALRRVRVDDGTLEWTDPISPDSATTTPIVLSHGGVDLFAYSSNTDAFFTFDPSSGASTSTTFGWSLYDAPPDLAVGADGSLYVTHFDDVGTANEAVHVSRVGPDGVVRWTSVELATLGPPPDPAGGEVFPSVIALGPGDPLWTSPGSAAGTIAGDGTILAWGPSIRAIDPATGATEWELPSAAPGLCILDAALTSEGGIVALQCDGTLFGASD